MNIVLIHGLGANPLTLWPLKVYLAFKFPKARILVPSYDTKGIASTQELVERVSQALDVDKTTPLHVVGQSLGGIAAMNLHTQGWNIVKAVTVGSPLHGASILNKLPMFDRGTYTYLRTKSKQAPPPHAYHTISMGILNSDFDSCVYKHETKLVEQHHSHEPWLEHRFGFLHPRLWKRIAQVIL